MWGPISTTQEITLYSFNIICEHDIRLYVYMDPYLSTMVVMYTNLEDP